MDDVDDKSIDDLITWLCVEVGLETTDGDLRLETDDPGMATDGPMSPETDGPMSPETDGPISPETELDNRTGPEDEGFGASPKRFLLSPLLGSPSQTEKENNDDLREGIELRTSPVPFTGEPLRHVTGLYEPIAVPSNGTTAAAASPASPREGSSTLKRFSTTSAFKRESKRVPGDSLAAQTTCPTPSRIHGRGAAAAATPAPLQVMNSTPERNKTSKSHSSRKKTTAKLTSSTPKSTTVSSTPKNGKTFAVASAATPAAATPAAATTPGSVPQARSSAKKKNHAPRIDANRIEVEFRAKISNCPYPSCESADCILGAYYLSQGQERYVVWGHRCEECGGDFHQVENHGKVEIYRPWRVESDGKPRDFLSVVEYVIANVEHVKPSWLGKPDCNFGLPKKQE